MLTRFFCIVITKKELRVGGIILLLVILCSTTYQYFFPPPLGALPREPSKPVGASSGEQLYGRVIETALPWYYQPSARFNELRNEYEADLLVSAFRTTLPNPIYQEEDNVAVAAGYLAGTVVRPGEIFSLNVAIGPRTQGRGFGYGPMYINGEIGSTIGGGICKVATTMYNVVMLSDLQVIERHPHSMPVPYVPPGRDATIVWGAKDFRFKNNKETPVVIWSEVHNNTLFIALYGQYNPPIVEWYSEELGRNKTWTIERQNTSLPAGEVRVSEGYDGITVRTWVNVHYPNLPMERRDLGVDYYRPMPGLLEYGP